MKLYTYQRGQVPPSAYIALFVLVFAGSCFLYVRHIMEANKELEIQNSALTANVQKLEGEAKVQAKLSELHTQQLTASLDKQADNYVKAEKEKQRVTEERLAKESAKKATLITRIAHKAIAHNIAVLGCESDLRKAESCGTIQ